MLSLDDANGIQRVVDEDGDGEEDDDNNNDDEHDGGGDDEEANVVVDDDHAEDEPPLSSRSGATAPIRPTGSQAPVPLSITSRVTSDTYKELAKETLEYFLAYARKENDTLYLKPWRQVKSNTPSVSVVRKMLDESTPADVLRANIALNVKPETVFAALKGPRYRNVANPDLVTCDTLVQYEDGVAVRNYRYKGSLLPDRDCVVLEVSQQISSTEWVVIQVKKGNKKRGAYLIMSLSAVGRGRRRRGQGRSHAPLPRLHCRLLHQHRGRRSKRQRMHPHAREPALGRLRHRPPVVAARGMGTQLAPCQVRPRALVRVCRDHDPAARDVHGLL